MEQMNGGRIIVLLSYSAEFESFEISEVFAKDYFRKEICNLLQRHVYDISLVFTNV